jgi:hypothetical protein
LTSSTSITESIGSAVGVLSVAINTLYVILTYQMLTAMRRDSLREHRLRHLGDIKAQIAQPLLNWLDSNVMPVLDGRQPSLLARDVPLSKTAELTGQISAEYKTQLTTRLQPPLEIDSSLFRHAKEYHFASELGAFENFESEVRRFFSQMLAVGRDCADDIASTTTLSRYSTVVTTYARSDKFVMACFQDLLGEREPQFNLCEAYPDDLIELDHPCVGDIARGQRDAVTKWSAEARKRVTERWASTNLGSRARQLIAKARIVQEELRLMELTYDLGKDCAYVGVRSHQTA